MTTSLSASTVAAIRRGSYLPDDWVPTDDVVIIGRGKKVHGHAGNQKLRTIVETEVQAYSNAKNRAAKTKIIIRVFKAIRADSQIGFVKKDPSNQNKYYAVEDTSAKITIAQYFRDALADKGGYKSSKAYKQRLRDAIKRSVSDCAGDDGNDTFLAACSRTSLRRCQSAGNPTMHSGMPPIQVSRDSLMMFQDDTSTAAGSMMHGRRQAVRSILQSASNLLDASPEDGEDDDLLLPSAPPRNPWEEMAGDIEETNISTVVPTSESELKISSKDVFTSLYHAFGSDQDMTSNPYEPTPLRSAVAPPMLQTSTSADCPFPSSKMVLGAVPQKPVSSTSPSAPSPFSFNYEDAFGRQSPEQQQQTAV